MVKLFALLRRHPEMSFDGSCRTGTTSTGR